MKNNNNLTTGGKTLRFRAYIKFMPNLLLHQDYRDYLKQVFEERKNSNSFYSYRVWAHHLEMDAAQLFKILAKTLHLPMNHLETMCKDLELSKSESQYFSALVELGRARTKKAKEAIIEKLLTLRDVKAGTLTREQYLFFKDWYHTSLRCLVGASDHQDLKRWADSLIPPISLKEVKESLDLQLKLGLLKKVSNKWKLSETHLSTDDKEVSKSIRDYQAQMHLKGAEALERFHKEDRDISTLSFAVDKQCSQDIKEILRECRQQIQRRIADSKSPDRVLHLNMSLFPTAKVDEDTPFKERS